MADCSVFVVEAQHINAFSIRQEMIQQPTPYANP
jgi:hypothetical protein